MMRARQDRDGLWVVTEGQRWWSVHIHPSGASTIRNEKLMPVKPHGALGKRLLRAVAEAQGRRRVREETASSARS